MANTKPKKTTAKKKDQPTKVKAPSKKEALAEIAGLRLRNADIERDAHFWKLCYESKIDAAAGLAKTAKRQLAYIIISSPFVGIGVVALLTKLFE